MLSPPVVSIVTMFFELFFLIRGKFVELIELLYQLLPFLFGLVMEINLQIDFSLQFADFNFQGVTSFLLFFQLYRDIHTFCLRSET